MAVGFRIKDASGNVTIDSSETTALLQERLEKTALGSGTKTYTGITSRNAYAVGLCEAGGAAGIVILKSKIGYWKSVNLDEEILNGFIIDLAVELEVRIEEKLSGGEKSLGKFAEFPELTEPLIN